MVADVRTELLLEGIWTERLMWRVPLYSSTVLLPPPRLGPVHDHVALIPTGRRDKSNNAECALTITLNIFNSI